jgi:RNA 3'-terminal phosphate cyclase (ATP)
VVLDGSYGEGGGTLVRTALAMSAITQQPVAINQVRAGTRYPGADVEDLALISALEQITGAEPAEIYQGSDKISFTPKHASRSFDGSVGGIKVESRRRANALILLNTIHSVLVHTGSFSETSAEGETFGNNTLSYDSFSECTLEALKKLGAYAQSTLKEAAFGRESNGLVSLEVEPSFIAGVDWAERGQLEEVTAYVSYSHLTEAIPQRAASHLITLARQAKLKMNIELQKVSAPSPGIHVSICARYERGFGSGSMMGTRGVRVEAVAASAFDQLFDYIQSKAAIDSYLADQLLLFGVFAHDSVTFSVSNISQRLLTAIWVVKQFMPIRISVTGEEGFAGLIKITKS